MENKYTERDINLFYERFKHLPEYFEIGNVHQLVNNPNAKATHTVKFNYKHLKFIIMKISGRLAMEMKSGFWRYTLMPIMLIPNCLIIILCYPGIPMNFVPKDILDYGLQIMPAN